MCGHTARNKLIVCAHGMVFITTFASLSKKETFPHFTFYLAPKIHSEKYLLLKKQAFQNGLRL